VLPTPRPCASFQHCPTPSFLVIGESHLLHLAFYNWAHMSRDRRMAISVGLNIVIVLVQVVFGLRAHSLGLVADAAHNLTDVAALGLSLWALRLIRRRPTNKQSFGYHRSGILAAQANAAMILIATAFITYEGIRRLQHPRPVEGMIVIVVAAIALAANGISAVLLNDRSQDVNMRSALLHMAGDAAASAGVVLAGIVIFTTGRFFWLDPAVSIAIGLIIAWRAIALLMETTDILMEATPKSLDLTALLDALRSADGIESFHDLHAWSISSELNALSAHLVLTGHPSLEEAQVVGQRIKDLLSHDFAIGHATLELECEPCAAHGDECLPTTVQLSHSHHH
jgi:cobalt-zinc-cadmium efflux system protein